MDDNSDSGASELPAGHVVGERYRIEALLGEGGVGRVYRARHVSLDRSVALKVLLAQHEGREVLRERFRREAAALASLSHPHIVAVTDFGVDGETLFLVMEMLDGQSLADLLRSETLDPARAISIVRQILLALAYAHARKVVHRDLKPHNIFVRRLDDGSDHVTVLDFGLARFVGDRQSGAQLTRAGMVIGTPAYMAPEQASGDVDAMDARTDIYAVGLLLFEVLTGRRPFATKDPGALLRAHLLENPPTLAEADPELEPTPELEAIVARALAKQPEERYPGAAQMLAALDAIGPKAARRRSPAGPKSGELAELVEAPTMAATPSKQRARSTATRAQAKSPDAKSADAKSAPQPRSSRLVLAFGFIAGLVVLGVVVGVWIVWTSLSSPEPPPRVVVPVPPPPAVDAHVPPPVSTARDPFAEPMPEPLASYHAQVRGGRKLSQSRVRELRSWAREHEEDAARAHLVLAHNFFLHRPLSYATLPEYEAAMEIDPSVRGDPQMLHELLMLARSASQHQSASDFIVRWYGAEALPAIDAMLAEGLQAPDPQRLQRVRARVVDESP